MYISRIGYSQTTYSLADEGAVSVKFLHILKFSNIQIEIIVPVE